MNNAQNLFFLLIAVLCLFKLSHADTGCMDRSKHAYFCNDGAAICHNASRYGNDMKRWHRVPCSCPCWKYKPASRRNICVYCNHAHDPAENARAAKDIDYPTIRLTRAMSYAGQRPAYYVPKKIQRCQD